MNIKMSLIEILSMLKKQLSSFYFLSNEEELILSENLENTLERVKLNFSYNKNKYFINEKGETIFEPLNTNQWLIFLYYYSKEILIKTQNTKLCDKIYGLLKIFSSSDIFYEVNLPQIFSCDHPHGTVLGRASYSNYFVFSHGCTVGGNKDIYPKIDERVAMMSNSKIIGHCFIGRNVIISANCYIKDIDIPSNSIVFGQSPNLIIKSNKKFIDEYFESIFLLNKQNQHF